MVLEVVGCWEESLANQESAGGPESEPRIDDEGNKFENVSAKPLGMNWCIKFGGAKHFHGPADRGQTKLITQACAHMS